MGRLDLNVEVEMDSSKTAVIFVPATGAQRDSIARWRRECANYALHRGYSVLSVTSDVDAVAAEWVTGRADRVIVARPEHRALLTAAVEVAVRPPARAWRRTKRTPRPA